MRLPVAVLICLGATWVAVGCSNTAKIDPKQQAAWDDRNPKDFHGPPPGVGPGNGPAPGTYAQGPGGAHLGAVGGPPPDAKGKK